ncbi:MAG: PilZ domain-containing protein [Vulcanococcus sp.]
MNPPDRNLGFQPSADHPHLSVWTVLNGRDDADLQSRREHTRNPVEACRPIALQLIDAEGAPISAWHQADILDVSLGGFCLLLMEDVPLELTQLMRLRLDVRPHPSFRVDEVMAELRWFVRSGLIVSLGVGFENPLQRLPVLLPCRRADRRPIDGDHTLP